MIKYRNLKPVFDEYTRDVYLKMYSKLKEKYQDGDILMYYYNNFEEDFGIILVRVIEEQIHEKVTDPLSRDV